MNYKEKYQKLQRKDKKFLTLLTIFLVFDLIFTVINMVQTITYNKYDLNNDGVVDTEDKNQIDYYIADHNKNYNVIASTDEDGNVEVTVNQEV